MYFDKRYRKDLIVGMNAIMISMNNEDAYCEWIFTVPDEVDEDELEEISQDDELFEECVREFLRIFRKYNRDGLYVLDKLYK